MAKIKLINETTWRTVDLAAIISRLQAAAPPEADFPLELRVVCGPASDRKPMEKRFTYFRKAGKYGGLADEATLTLPCGGDLPARGLASVLARGFGLHDSEAPLQQRVKTTRLIKHAGRMPVKKRKLAGLNHQKEKDTRQWQTKPTTVTASPRRVR